jgi:hypothetical protein
MKVAHPITAVWQNWRGMVKSATFAKRQTVKLPKN